jgi:hypothetical protein
MRLRRDQTLLVAATAGAILTGGALVLTQFPAAGNDDSHITYWAAHALGKFGAVINYNGEHIEQSSSLGFVALLALVERLTGVAPPTAAWVLSILSAAICVVVAAWVSSHITPRGAVWAPLLLGTWLPLLYWSTSGMEMTLAAVLGCTASIVFGEFIVRPSDLFDVWSGGDGAVLRLSRAL